VVDVVDCVLLGEIRKPPYCVDRRYEWLQDDPWADGAWCWVRGEKTRPLEWPVQWRGERGIFEVPDGVLEEHAETSKSRQVETRLRSATPRQASKSGQATLFG